MKFKIVILLISSSCIFWHCANNPGFSDIPEIEFISFSKDSLIQNSLNTDSLILRIAFRDGDGDIGSGGEDITENIVITDNRTGVIFDRFKIPEIPVSGLQSGIEGELIMKVFTTCCVFPDLTPPCLNPPQFPTNDLSFDIQMIDDSGNKSNVITTNAVTLLCN